MKETVVGTLRLYWRFLCAVFTVGLVFVFTGNRIFDRDSTQISPYAEPVGAMYSGAALARDLREKAGPTMSDRFLRQGKGAGLRPESGAYFGDDARLRTEPVEIDAAKMPTDLWIGFLGYEAPMKHSGFTWCFSLYVRSGEVVRTSLPAGIYEILAITGAPPSRGAFPQAFLSGGAGRFLGRGFEFGGTTGKVSTEGGRVKVRETYRKYRGYRFQFLPSADGAPGFSKVRMKRIRLK